MNSLFRECLKKDLDIFFNLEEFGEIRKFNGYPAIMIVQESTSDRDEQGMKTYDSATLEMYQESKTVYLKYSGNRPEIAEKVTLDDDEYFVAETSVSEGILKMIITKAENYR